MELSNFPKIYGSDNFSIIGLSYVINDIISELPDGGYLPDIYIYNGGVIDNLDLFKNVLNVNNPVIIIAPETEHGFLHGMPGVCFNGVINIKNSLEEFKEYFLEYLRNSESLKKPPARYVLDGMEKKLIHLMKKGFSTKSIAARMGVSDKTVSYHKRKMMRRFKLHSDQELFFKVMLTH